MKQILHDFNLKFSQICYYPKHCLSCPLEECTLRLGIVLPLQLVGWVQLADRANRRPISTRG